MTDRLTTGGAAGGGDPAGVHGLTQAELDQLAAEAPRSLSGAQRAAIARGRDRRALEAMGGGLEAAGIPKCPHGRLRACCELCEHSVDGLAL